MWEVGEDERWLSEQWGDVLERGEGRKKTEWECVYELWVGCDGEYNCGYGRYTTDGILWLPVEYWQQRGKLICKLTKWLIYKCK